MLAIGSSLAVTVLASLCSDSSQGGTLWKHAAEADDCLQQKIAGGRKTVLCPCFLLPHSSFQTSEMADGDAEEEWLLCTAVTPVWGRKQTDPPSLVASLSQLPCLSLALSKRRSIVLLGRMCPVRPGDLQPSQALRQSPSHHRPHCTPRLLHHCKVSGCALICLWPVTDCLASLRCIAFPEPLKKKAFPCEMVRSFLTPDSPFHYYLFYLQQLPSKLRLHIQTANPSTIHQHTELPNPGSD